MKVIHSVNGQNSNSDRENSFKMPRTARRIDETIEVYHSKPKPVLQNLQLNVLSILKMKY